MSEATKEQRLDAVNTFLEAVASCGRRFFRHEGRTARMEVDDRGRIWFIDHYTGKRIYTHYRYRWRGFTSGGTLRRLVERLRDYVRTGARLPAASLGPWPEWICNGDLWGYGEDMETVRKAARDGGLLAEPSPVAGEEGTDG